MVLKKKKNEKHILKSNSIDFLFYKEQMRNSSHVVIK